MLNNLKQYSALCLFGFIGILNAYAADNMNVINDVPVVYKWDKPGIPHKDWIHEGVEDLEDITGQCQMCDKKYIRYLHTVSHDEYDNLEVGRDCAEKMCEDYANPKQRERNVKNAAQRARRAAEREAAVREDARRRAAEREAAAREDVRRNWLNLAYWRATPKGGYSRKLGDAWITIFKKELKWKYVFKNNFSPPYGSVQQAILDSYNQYLNR